MPRRQAARPSSFAVSLREELKECPLNLLRMGPCDVVRPAFDPDQPDVVDQRRQTLGRRADRRDPILGAVHDERRDVDLCDVAANVGQ